MVIAAFTAIIFLFNMLLQLQEMRMLEESKELMCHAKQQRLTEAKESCIWSAFYKKITGPVPLEEEEDILL